MTTRLSFADRIDEAQKQKNLLYAVEKTLPREIAKVLLNNKEFNDSLRGQNGVDGIAGMNGDQGPVGPRGPQGEPGKDGRDGVDGKDGRDGRDGKDGKDAENLKGIDFAAFEDGRYSFNYLRNVPKSVSDFKNQVTEIAVQEILNRRTTGFIQELANVSIDGIADTNTLVWDAALQIFKPGVGGSVSATGYYVQQALAIGTNVITHNLNLAVPKSVIVQVRNDATGEEVVLPITAYTANSLTLTALSAVALVNINIK